MSTKPDHRKQSRRRGAVLDAAILDAALAEINDIGYSRLSMEHVAERAGASKASLYRRWPSKVELVMDTIYHNLPGPQSSVDTGSLRDDLLHIFHTVAEQLAGTTGRAMRGLLSDVMDDPERAARMRFHSRGDSVQSMREIVRRAADRGELDAAAITPRQMEAGPALLRFEVLTSGEPVSDALIVEIVDEVVLPLFRATPAP